MRYIISLLLISAIAYGNPNLETDISFTLVKEIVLPDSIAALYQDSPPAKFIDIDKDGWDEMVLENDSVIFVWVEQGNLINKTLGKENRQPKSKYTFGLFDNDSLIDFLELYVDTANTNISEIIMGRYFYGINDYLPTDTFEYIDFNTDDDTVYTVSFRSIYVEVDEFYNLTIFASIILGEYRELYMISRVSKNQYHYYRFDSQNNITDEIDTWPYVEDAGYRLNDSTQCDILPYHYYGYEEGIGSNHTNYLYSRDYWRTFVNDELVSSFQIMPDSGCGINMAQEFLMNNINVIAVSDDGGSYNLTALIRHWEYGHIYYQGIYSPDCEIIFHKLLRVNLIAYDSLETVWEIIYEDHPGFEALFAVDSLPNYFFIFQNDKLYLHDAGNGLLVDSSEIISTGRYLGYSSIDPSGTKYLIFFEDDRIKFFRLDVLVDVALDNIDALPTSFKLEAPYPNPFNPTVIIPLSIPRKADLSVTAFNILGQRVADIYDGELKAGNNEITWDAGKQPTGIYFIHVKFEDQNKTTKVILLK